MSEQFCPKNYVSSYTTLLIILRCICGDIKGLNAQIFLTAVCRMYVKMNRKGKWGPFFKMDHIGSHFLNHY